MIHFSTPYRPLARCVRLTSAAGLQKRLDCTLCRLRGFHIHSRNAPITRTVKKRHLNSPLTPSGFPPMFRPTKPYVPRLAGDVKIFFNPTLSRPFSLVFCRILLYISQKWSAAVPSQKDRMMRVTSKITRTAGAGRCGMRKCGRRPSVVFMFGYLPRAP